MDIWYTPERIQLHQEIGERRIARYERRMARLARQERQERFAEHMKFAGQVILGAALMYGYLFFGALWASM